MTAGARLINALQWDGQKEVTTQKMVEMSPGARQVYEAMIKLGASSEESMKSADQIMAAARMGKGLVTSGLAELERLKIVARKAREKRAGYYVSQKV